MRGRKSILDLVQPCLPRAVTDSQSPAPVPSSGRLWVVRLTEQWVGQGDSSVVRVTVVWSGCHWFSEGDSFVVRLKVLK